MAVGISDYTRRAAVLLQAAERFEASLDDHRRRDAAVGNLLAAAEQDSFADVRLGFEATPGSPESPAVSGRLSAVLFDLQSANVLIAAGLKAETKDQGGGDLLKQARLEIGTTRDELLAPATVPTGFAATLNLDSATLESAATQFRNYSSQLLGEIVDGADKTIKVATTELGKLKPADLLNALGEIGEALPSVVVQAGQILRTGLEKLKRAIQALMDMFGAEALKGAREQIERILKEVKPSSRDLVELVLGAHAVRERIQAILAGTTLAKSKVDAASNALPDLARAFNRDNKLLRAVLRAIQLSALFVIVAPWLTPALALAYVSAIGIAVLIGRQYAGQTRVLSWIDGVEQVAERIP